PRPPSLFPYTTLFRSDLQFSLNLSCDDLLDVELSGYILQRLQDPALAQRVIFEILESEGIENYRAVRQFIDEAKALGCRIAIDEDRKSTRLNSSHVKI